MTNPVFILAQATPGTNSPPAGTDTAAEGSSAIAGFFDSGALGLLLADDVAVQLVHDLAGCHGHGYL